MFRSLKESWFTKVWQSRLHQETRLYYSIKERNIEKFKKYLNRIYAWVDHRHSRYFEDEADLKYVLNKSLEYACSYGTPEMVKLLIDGKGSIKARVYLCMLNYTNDYDYSRYTSNGGKDSALMIVCQREPSVETSQIVDILFHTAQYYLFYPFMEAIKRANVDVVRKFIEEGFSVREEHLNTIISSAKQTGSADLMNCIEPFVEQFKNIQKNTQEKPRKADDLAPRMVWYTSNDDWPPVPMHG